MADRIDLNETAIRELMHDPDGPIGHALEDLGRDMAAMARIVAPVRFGTLKGSIASRLDYSASGELRAHVSEIWRGIFTETPARQMHRPHRALLTALDWAEGRPLI